MFNFTQKPMEAKIICILLISCLGVKAQDKMKIYYDNRDNSIVKFLSQPDVSLILAENPTSGFSTVNFVVSKVGKVISIRNLLESKDLSFRAAREALEKSSGSWIIKQGLDKQMFQITFYVISTRLDSLKKLDVSEKKIQVSLNQYIKYNDQPIEITLLPTVKILYKEQPSKISITH
jgi:hypothetical protein